MAFSLASYPWVYRAKYQTGTGAWNEEWLEKPHLSPEAEEALPPGERAALLEKRNQWSDMPLVSFTSQYGLGCFEGVKALPQKNGGLAIFRPGENAKRFRRSMEGLLMPGFPEELFTQALIEGVRRNAELGFAPSYNTEWEKDSFKGAQSIYIRPFSYGEGGVGVAPSRSPWAIVIFTPVSAYFTGGRSTAVTTDRIRATARGTGWIKADSNYVISTIAKQEANDAGYMECIFLDAREGRYLEEGSSCNIFLKLKSGELVTPELGDTILPGINRASVMELARDLGVTVSERRISIEEAMDEGEECFVTGTAAGVTPLESITHKGKTACYTRTGPLTQTLRETLKGIQYGTLPDTKGWMVAVS